MPKKITEMFAFVVVGDDGDEGIPAIQMGDLMMPLVGADMERIDSLRPQADEIGLDYTIKRFKEVP